jgi:hypothetical protein
MKRSLLVVLTAAVFAVSCLAAELAGKNVLLVADKAHAGDPVVAKIIAILKEEKARVRLGANSDMKPGKSKGFNAVIFINYETPGKTEKSVRMFGDENLQKKTVLFNAVGPKYWMTKSSSGRQTDESGEIAARIVKRVELLLQSK